MNTKLKPANDGSILEYLKSLPSDLLYHLFVGYLYCTPLYQIEASSKPSPEKKFYKKQYVDNDVLSYIIHMAQQYCFRICWCSFTSLGGLVKMPWCM
jgi:hypothetical protein